jgi:cation diffusion facilitator family transporter
MDEDVFLVSMDMAFTVPGHTLRPAAPVATSMIKATAKEKAQSDRAKRSIIAGLILCFVFMIIEFVLGLVSNSLAIMTDAAHMLTDVGSLALALFAVVASQWGPSENFTFGFKRAEVVGALFSVILVWVLVGAIVYEGVVRLINVVHCARGTESQYTECEGIDARIMLIVGCGGLVINI